MRSVALAACLLGSVGCTEKAADLRLNWPAENSDIANMDVSCVNSVHVIVQGFGFEDYNEDCIEVTSPTSYDDLQAQIRGKLELELPDNTVYVEVRGQGYATPGGDFCGTGMNVFHAVAEYTGGDLTLNVEGTIDCSAIMPDASLKIHPIDMLALANTPAGAAPVCETAAMPPSDQALEIGALRPTNLVLPGYESTFMELAELPGVLDGSAIGADGMATVPALGATLPTSCLAVANLEGYGASCIYPSNPSVCAATGEVEFLYISDLDSKASTDGVIYEEFPSLVHGLVYERDPTTGTKKPVAGATVSLNEGRGVVVYATPQGQRFVPITGATTTDASGAFLAYMREPSVVTVTQGASTKAMRIGAPSYGGSAVAVPLR